MLNDPLLAYVRAKLEEEINVVASNLANGSVSSFDDYKRQTGMIKGMKLALTLLAEAEKHYLADDD